MNIFIATIKKIMLICMVKTQITYGKSMFGPSPPLCRSLVPKILLKLNSVPSFAVASPTINTAFSTANTGPTWIFL